MQQLSRLIQSDFMALGFSWIAFALMIYTYGLYIHKAMFYFGKASISHWLSYRLIQTAGILLILLFTVVGYGCRGHLIGSLVSIVLFLLSIYLITTATIQHKHDKLKFAFSSNRIKFLTTDGVYRFIRHPIYTAYVLGWIAGLIFTQVYIALPLMIVLIALYVIAINQEEAEFLKSEFADEYKGYKSRTHRMIPLIY